MECLLQVFEALSGAEQLGLMSALGSYHVWATLARPDGLHFRLDLTIPEQRDVAREVVKVGTCRGPCVALHVHPTNTCACETAGPRCEGGRTDKGAPALASSTVVCRLQFQTDNPS